MNSRARDNFYGWASFFAILLVFAVLGWIAGTSFNMTPDTTGDSSNLPQSSIPAPTP